VEHTEPSLVDHLIHELQIRVAERRKSGFYPYGLERDLEDHFRRVVAHRAHANFDELRSNLKVLEVRSLFSPERIPVDTSIPGGALVHRTIAKVVSRQTQGILEQVQEFADIVRETLSSVAKTLEDPGAHVHADLVGQLDAVFERLAAFERGPIDSAASVADLRRRVEALEATEQGRRFDPWYSADAFESAFRGAREDLIDRYGSLADMFIGHGPVVDIGCGRGEFLELLAERGVEAYGIEVDAALVEEAQARGLPVTLDDAVRHVASVPDNSLGGITLIQVVEHLTPQSVVDLVGVASEKVVRGGLMVLETVNPQSLYTFAHSFYLDPTHGNPVHPAYLKFLFDEAGWSRTEIDWRTEPPADDVLADDSEANPVQKANTRRLNQLLFAPQDYALVAHR
jgi:2-polyprenyl-3-methyl-5-hydroxy-6-metoxy-1,4-benzoquinol methylase